MESKRDTAHLNELKGGNTVGSISESKREQRETKVDSLREGGLSTSRTEPYQNSSITPATNSSSTGAGASTDVV